MAAARTLDLSSLLHSSANMTTLGDAFEGGFRRRPERIQNRWIFTEPVGGMQPNPLLTVGAAIELKSNDFGEVARRVASFLSMEFDKDRPPTPTLRISKGYGLLSEMEQICIDVFFAKPGDEQRQRIQHGLLPFMVEKFGTSHVCVVRPNYSATQKRLSLLKMFWATQAFGAQSLQQKVMNERVLDSILPSPHDMMSWIEAFLTLAPLQVVLPIQFPGGYAVFFSDKIWTFPRAPVAGMLGNFLTSVPLATSGDVPMIQSVAFKNGDPYRAHAYIQMVSRFVNELVNFSTNLLNFESNQQLQGLRQVQFVSALGLMMKDIRSANATVSSYERMSFCFSALDKLANIVAMSSPRVLDESKVFRRLFSAVNIRALRRIIRGLKGREHSVQDELLASLPARVLEVQQSIRKQMRGNSKESQRLDWLWSYRNLRHGTYLRQNQFQNLFVGAAGEVPAELAEATMALIIGLAVAPADFLSTF